MKTIDLAKRYKMNLNTVKGWLKLYDKNLELHDTAGHPPSFDRGQLVVVKHTVSNLANHPHFAE